MRKCDLSNCGAEHEGYCTLDLKECNATTDDMLITAEEYDRRFKLSKISKNR